MKKIITFLTILMLSCAGIFAQEVDGDIPDGASFVFDGFEKEITGFGLVLTGISMVISVMHPELIFRENGLLKVLILLK